MTKNIFPRDERDRFKENRDVVHSVLLRILKVISNICARHNIIFWLEYGTMLGGVRHKGFIPWDMEADIGMLRSDFNKLKRFVATELPNDMFFQTPETDPFYPKKDAVEAKIRDKYSNYTGFQKTFPQLQWHNGIQVDIFVFDVYQMGKETILLNKFEKNSTGNYTYYKAEEIERLIECPFEDTIFPIPHKYKSYLSRVYENYTQFPPLHKQVAEEVDPYNPCNHKEILHWQSG